MWPLDRPAREVLKPPGQTPVPWAVFDWRWYLGRHQEVAAIVGDDDPASVLEYYVEIGQKQGHAPNRMFDERWHRLAYPQIADRIKSGDYASAFDAYCRRGAIDRSAHWLFDERGYRDRYPDLTDGVLAEFDLCNGYDHYLRHGAAEDRIGHVLFDPGFYLSNFDPPDAAVIRRDGVFQHYLARIESNEPELRTSIFFDPAWYRTRYPEVAQQIETKRWKCALHHYLCNDSPTAFDPLPAFSESWYLQRDPGLLQVIAGGRGFRNGYMHFLKFGARELRSPSASIDLGWYAAQPQVKADLDQARAADAYAHWLAIGAPAGLPSAKPVSEKATDAQARDLLRQYATALLPIAGRFGYRFECAGSPEVSVVMVVRDGFASTMATIASLRGNTAADMELIIVDLGSTDETCSILHYVPGVRLLRFDAELEWPRAADAGRQLASAPLVLFLSAEARIAPGSVGRACGRLTAETNAGAVGGMILQPSGVIAQAGGILWNHGAAHDYRRDSSPLHPEANFVRDVDFCAPAFLMVRADLLTRLDGFDHDCAGVYSVVDLCLRITQAGFRVVYDPSVAIVVGDPAPQGRPGEHFLQKHAATLAERYPPGGPVQVFARHAGARPSVVLPNRILFIEDTVPLRRTGSGFVRANDVVHVMAALGYAVTVFPVNGTVEDPARLFGDMPDSAEVMHTLSLDRLGAFLAARPNYYDTVWIARTHNLTHVRSVLLRAITDGGLNARIVLDTEAVTPHREVMQAMLGGDVYDLLSAMQAMLADADICHHVVAVTPAEADALRCHALPSVSVIGHMIEPRPTVRAFDQRAGILFVGAIHKADGPNLDSLRWFVDAVLPLIEAELGWETRLTIAGYVAPGIDLCRFAQHPRITLRGQLADIDPLYNAHRVFVAPTRFAAGAPYKVLEAASRGVPVVATDVLGHQLEWQPAREIMTAGADDPAGFAAAVVRLYRDAALWHSVRDGALRRLRQDNGRESFVAAVRSVLGPGSTPAAGQKTPNMQRLVAKKRLNA